MVTSFLPQASWSHPITRPTQRLLFFLVPWLLHLFLLAAPARIFLPSSLQPLCLLQAGQPPLARLPCAASGIRPTNSGCCTVDRGQLLAVAVFTPSKTAK